MTRPRTFVRTYVFLYQVTHKHIHCIFLPFSPPGRVALQYLIVCSVIGYNSVFVGLEMLDKF